MFQQLLCRLKNTVRGHTFFVQIFGYGFFTTELYCKTFHKNLIQSDLKKKNNVVFIQYIT